MAPWWLRSSSDEMEDAATPSPQDSPEEATSVESSERVKAEEAAEPEARPNDAPALEARSELPEPNREKIAESPDNTAVPAVPEASEKPTKKRRRRRRRKGSTSFALSSAEERSQEEPRSDRVMTPPPAFKATTEPGTLAKELVYAMPERNAGSDERKIAIFCDLENIALGVRDSDTKQFDVTLILERLLEKGKIIVKKAYADWERFQEYKRAFHEAAIELIDIPQKYYSGKNSADIKMVVDAMDLCYSKEHLDTFVIVSGDSDFSPLVSKLKENNKYVIGVGVKNSSSNLLISNCDEFIYYEDLWRDAQRAPRLDSLEPKSAEVFRLMTDAMLALRREDKDLLWGSMIKQTMKRKRPSFNEGYYGYSSFSQLLEDAERRKLIRLKRDQGAGNYLVTWFAESW